MSTDPLCSRTGKGTDLFEDAGGDVGERDRLVGVSDICGWIDGWGER